jgi:hypothetical protein
MRQPLAGHLLTSQIHSNFKRTTPTRSFPLSLLPRHLIAQRDPSPLDSTAIHQPKPILRDDRIKQTTESWTSWGENSVVEAWKEACAEVVNVRGYDLASANNLPLVNYELPDGYSKAWGEERYRFSEMLFDPKHYFDQVSPFSSPSLPRLLLFKALRERMKAHSIVNRTTCIPPSGQINRTLSFPQRPRTPKSISPR